MVVALLPQPARRMVPIAIVCYSATCVVTPHFRYMPTAYRADRRPNPAPIHTKLYLDVHPGAYGVVRLTLGHKSVDTTTQFYCGTETAPALRYHDEHTLKIRNAPMAKVVSGKRRAAA
jgi:hypothetical protein